MVKEVWPWLTGGLLVTLVAALAGPLWLAALCAALTLFVASFFRDPRRVAPADPNLIVSPADGKVVRIAADPAGFPPGSQCVSVFLSVFNVHVNRAPADGRVEGIRYTPGSFLPAFADKASDANEQNLIQMQTARGPIAVKQIAGLIARRIRCWISTGSTVERGDKIGFFTFGSRVDLYLPPGARLLVGVGDRVRGGTTAVAAFPPAGTRA